MPANSDFSNYHLDEDRPSDAATPVVSAFYDRFPYPGDPLQDGPPPGHNWRWCYQSVLSAVHGCLPATDHQVLRILDAGCGTGVSTDYLCHLNPGAEVLAVDISPGALEVARERLQRSGGEHQVKALRQEQRSLLDLQNEGPFDYINSVGVLHHLNDPISGLKALAKCLAPDGLLHLFLYADAGRWEIHRTQRALNLLAQGDKHDRLKLGRDLFQTLPESNRLRQSHEKRWSLDTAADANFADMYLHPQETSYELSSLMSLIKQAGLHFAGFSNPDNWSPKRLLKGDLLKLALELPAMQQWQLVEQLDPDISHFEFFLSHRPIQQKIWDQDAELIQAKGLRQRCLWGWPSANLLGPDFEPLALSEKGLELMSAIEKAPDIPIGGLGFGDQAAGLARELVELRVLLLRCEGGLMP